MGGEVVRPLWRPPHARRYRRAPHCTGGRCLLRLMTLMTSRGTPLGMLLWGLLL